jgi:hypothetical protein
LALSERLLFNLNSESICQRLEDLPKASSPSGKTPAIHQRRRCKEMRYYSPNRRVVWHACLALCAASSLLVLSTSSPSQSGLPFASLAPPMSPAGIEGLRPILLPSRILQAPPSTLRLRGGDDSTLVHEHSFEIRSGARFTSKVPCDPAFCLMHITCELHALILYLRCAICQSC